MLDRVNRSMSPTSQSHVIGSFSQLGLFHNHGGPGASHHHGLMPTAQEDILKLKKELRLKQAEYDKEKAILLQKNEQLEAQLKETTSRQQAQVQMYETMINSLKAPEISAPSDIIVAKIQESERLAYEGEINELKEHRKKLQEDILDREREFSRLTNDKDSFIKELQLNIDKVLMEKSQQMFQWEIERKELQQRIQAGLTDRDQAEAMIELKWQSKMSEQQMETERLKLEHMREIDKIKQECENSIKEVKALHEQEKYTLEYRLDRQSHDLKSLHHMVIQQDSATSDTHASTQQHREQLNIELSHIQAEVDAIKQQHEQTLANLTKEKENAEARNAKLLKQLEKLKNAPKQASQVVIDLPMKVATRGSESEEAPSDPEAQAALQRQVKNLKQEIELLQDENSKLGDQVKKLRKESQEMQDYAERLEANEKKLRKVLEDQATIEQEQVVELRRLLNQEKKRAIEQSEIMSTAKEALERENYRQATMLNEKEEQIRQMNHELKSHEKRLYEIQSMFRGEGINASQSMTENQMLMNQRQIAGQNGQHYIAQSLANFSPRNFGAGMVLRLERQGSGNQSMYLPNLDRNQSFASQQVEGGVIYNQITQLNQGKVECAHCFQLIDSNDFYEHLKTQHPSNGLDRQASHSQLIGLAALNLTQATQPHYPRDQPIAQSLCLSNRSTNQDYLNMLLTQTPQPDRQLPNIPRPPTSHNPLIHSSPKVPIPNRAMISNSRSFNCLLKEIDEEEERHIVGSLPQGGQVGRPEPIYLEHVTIEDDNRGPYVLPMMEQSQECEESLRKSRNNQQMKSSQSQAVINKRPSMASLKSNTYKEKASSKKNSSQNKSSQRKKSSANITSEIKDLLDKLVAYQGGNQNQSTQHYHKSSQMSQYGPQHCQSVAISSNQQNEKQSKINTESLVELRSSDSSLAYVPPPMHVESEIELRAPQTARDNKVTTSIQMKEGQRKQWNIQMISQDFKPQKGQENVTKPSAFEIIDKSEVSQLGRNLSISSNSSSISSEGPKTAKHTSKDTLLSIPGLSRKGRRYHDVNKSDVLTPNSPRRYQDYFRNRLHPSDSTALPPKHTMLIQNDQLKQASKPKLPHTKENGVTSSNTSGMPRAHKNHRYSPSNTKSIADESQYNQLSPSPEKPNHKQKNQNGLQQAVTQDESRIFVLNSSNPYNMPLQQVQNQLFMPGKQSNNRAYGTYDSGSVIYGAASDAIFKTQGSGSHLGGAQHNLMFGGVGFGFQPNATLSTVKAGAPSNVHNFEGVINCSMDDDGDIRPSQIDEFAELRTEQVNSNSLPQTVQFPDYGSGIGGAHITSSYITIGDDDPFITGRFNDATTKAFNFKPQSHCPSKIHNQSIPLSKNSDMQYYQQALSGNKRQ